jgi:dihydrofolate synthase/folylpolyglutamate synthase
LYAAKIKVSPESISRGLASVRWPARFQKWDERTIIDGAHNPAGTRCLVETWQEIFGSKRATVILGVLRDKDVTGICGMLAPIARQFLLPRIRSERALLPVELARILSANAASPPYSILSSIAEAIDLAQKESDPILMTGSLHFAGEALATLQGISAAYEECAQ